MEPTKLAILGAANMRCGPAIVGSLASYFGERPLEIRMYDADEERLDTFDRLARLCFVSTYASHILISTIDPSEALNEADLIVLAIDPNCAGRLLHPRVESEEYVEPYNADAKDVDLAVAFLLANVPDSIPVLSLLEPGVSVPRMAYSRLNWPAPLDQGSRYRVPMQILRWLNKEEMPYELLSGYDDSPLKAWLDDPRSGDLVLGSRS